MRGGRSGWRIKSRGARVVILPIANSSISVKVIAFLTSIFFCAIGLLQAKPDFTHPKSHLGSSDKDGCLYFWIELSKLELNDGSKLPVRLRFATGPKSGSSLLGRFWWCPVLESSLISTGEKSIEVTTLGGRRIALHLKKDGAFSSGDGRYKARAVSPSEMALSADGWEYRFVSGKLKSARRADGLELEWVYQGSKLLSLNDKAGGPLLSLEYAANGSLPAALVIGKDRYNLTLQQVPVTTEVAGQVVIAGYASSLATMRSEKTGLQFPIVLERDGKFRMDYLLDGSLIERYTWKSSNGSLETDGEWTYKASKMENGASLVERTNKAGKTQSYWYDTRTGVSEHKLPDGVLVARQYFVAEGPTRNKLRRLVRSKDGVEFESRQWSYDEMGRKIRERIGDIERTWEWRPDGKLAATTEKVGDKILKTGLFDSEGRIIEKSKGRFFYRYSYEGGKVVAQQFVEGKLSSTRVSDSKRNQSFFFSTNPDGGMTKGAVLSPASTASPTDMENARNLATQTLRSGGNEK